MTWASRNFIRFTLGVLSPAFVALAATPPGAGAQAQAVRHRSFMAITVSNLDASVQWYETYLGMRRVSASRARSGIAENVTVANDYMMAELIHFAARAATDTAIRDPHDVGLQKAGTWVDPVTFGSTLAHLRRLNARFVGGVFSDSAIKARSFIVKDTSGVLIQFFATIS